MRLMPSSPPPARQDPAGLGEIAPELLGGLRSEVLAWFAAAGRDLPWRHTRDPYRILVAEMLAQQTQATRAAAAWPEFLEAFPTVEALAIGRRRAHGPARSRPVHRPRGRLLRLRPAGRARRHQRGEGTGPLPGRGRPVRPRRRRQATTGRRGHAERPRLGVELGADGPWGDPLPPPAPLPGLPAGGPLPLEGAGAGRAATAGTAHRAVRHLGPALARCGGACPRGRTGRARPGRPRRRGRGGRRRPASRLVRQAARPPRGRWPGSKRARRPPAPAWLTWLPAEYAHAGRLFRASRGGPDEGWTRWLTSAPSTQGKPRPVVATAARRRRAAPAAGRPSTAGWCATPRPEAAGSW